jgi:hypothetical protein
MNIETIQVTVSILAIGVLVISLDSQKLCPIYRLAETRTSAAFIRIGSPFRFVESRLPAQSEICIIQEKDYESAKPVESAHAERLPKLPYLAMTSSQAKSRGRQGAVRRSVRRKAFPEMDAGRSLPVAALGRSPYKFGMIGTPVARNKK